MKFYREMSMIKQILSGFGHTVYVPHNEDIEDLVPIEARTDVTKDEIVMAKIEYDFIREHFKRIDKADAILVLNYEKKGIPNYIGGNTFLEMGHAFGLGKKIFLLYPIPDMDYNVEMRALQPIILDGDISKIE
jgi:nucleoside 2-deoxyribosyltransferase